MKIRLTDTQPAGSNVEPASTDYDLKIFGIDTSMAEIIARLEPPPVQTGALPQVKVSETTRTGKVTITFTKALSFPADMQAKVNNFTEPIIVEAGKPFVPKPNKFGFVEVPYVKLLLLASPESILEDLTYTWSCESVTSTSMVFQLNFESPLKISIADEPE